MCDPDLGAKLEIYRCPICMDMCSKSVELSCGHAFCRPCLTTSAANNMTSCALCRREQELNPELLRAQFDERRMLNLAQRLAIPAPLRPRQPTTGFSAPVNVGKKPNLASACSVIGGGKSVQDQRGDKATPSSSSADSMTTRGHLLFGPWSNVGAMTPQELRRRWKLTRPTSDVGAMSVKKLASSWQEVQRMSRASAVSVGEHGASGAPRSATSSQEPLHAPQGHSAYRWSGDIAASRHAAPGGSSSDPHESAAVVTTNDFSVGSTGPDELSTRWRALRRVPSATGVRRPSSVLSGISAVDWAEVEPLQTTAYKTKHMLPLTCAERVEADPVDVGACSHDIMTCTRTVGCLASGDLRERWHKAFQALDSCVGAVAVGDLAVRLALAKGPQGVGGMPSADLATRWVSTVVQYSGGHKHERRSKKIPRLEFTLAPAEGVGVGTAKRDAEGCPSHDTVRREQRFTSASNPVSPMSCQDVGAASTSSLCTRWRNARGAAGQPVTFLC